MTTYTLVIDTITCQLAACVPDDDEQTKSVEIADYLSQCDPDHQPEFVTVTGLTLTNDEPDNELLIEWQGHDGGWLTDENGEPYEYAVDLSWRK